MLEKGKEALTILNIPMMNPEVVHYIGRFFFRYSYGQNLRNHSIEAVSYTHLDVYKRQIHKKSTE